ncbi:LuxR family transcriptional regulator [Novosphingobium sp. PY1]|uniref:LuxR family transcriptional regulator n=1 Tax=Novosphingobium sp. PY1 TaxID=1882221 RepID=UPI001A901203|nr:autoinducer binding domain-containing protein [Novosphingobium sp. PY1]GFM28633.1 LuxR family transcriptional regulator [Novosphingobium sp. PY1]
MRIDLAEKLMSEVSSASSRSALFTALENATRLMSFDYFALDYDDCRASNENDAFLVHDYPPEWARVYQSLGLATQDPVRRTCERSFTSFPWGVSREFTGAVRGDHKILGLSREYGIGDGFTVPRHLPGGVTGSCTFVVRPDAALPVEMLQVADLLGGVALASAHKIAGLHMSASSPGLTDRQRECLLWWGRGKTAAEIAIIMGLSVETVHQHLKLARERYGVDASQSVLACAIAEGLIGPGDIWRWFRTRPGIAVTG